MMYLKICTGSMILATMMGSAYGAAERVRVTHRLAFKGEKEARKNTMAGLIQFKNHPNSGFELTKDTNGRLKLGWWRKDTTDKLDEDRREVVILGVSKISPELSTWDGKKKEKKPATIFHIDTDGTNPDWLGGIDLKVKDKEDRSKAVIEFIEEYFEEMFTVSLIDASATGNVVASNLRVVVTRGSDEGPIVVTDQTFTDALMEAEDLCLFCRTKVMDAMPKIVLGLRKIIQDRATTAKTVEAHWQELGASFRLSENVFNTQTINRMRMSGGLKDEAGAREHQWMYDAYFAASETVQVNAPITQEENDEKTRVRRHTDTVDVRIGLPVVPSPSATQRRLHPELATLARHASGNSTSTTCTARAIYPLGYEPSVASALEQVDEDSVVRQRSMSVQTVATQYTVGFAGPSAMA